MHFDQPAPESACLQISHHQVFALHLHYLHPELPGHEPTHYLCLLWGGSEEAVHWADWAQRDEIDGRRYEFLNKKYYLFINVVNIWLAELEWMLKDAGAVPSTIEKDPKPKVRDVLMSQLRSGRGDSDDDDDY